MISRSRLTAVQMSSFVAGLPLSSAAEQLSAQQNESPRSKQQPSAATHEPPPLQRDSAPFQTAICASETAVHCTSDMVQYTNCRGFVKRETHRIQPAGAMAAATE